MEIKFPLEFLVHGKPVSFQAKRIKAKEEWKSKVRQASSAVLPEAVWLSNDPISVTLYHFPEGEHEGDIDNSIKLVLDAMSGHIFQDDRQVERIVVQKFEGDRVFQFSDPSATMLKALEATKPVMYVCVSDKPLEELK